MQRRKPDVRGDSELVTKALVHGIGTISLRINDEADALRVEVSDQGNVAVAPNPTPVAGVCGSLTSPPITGECSTDRRPFQGKRPVCRPILGRPNQKSFCGPAEGRVFCLQGPLARLLLQRRDPVDSGCRGDTGGRGPWGQSGSSPETARSTSARSAATPSEPWHPEP
jgi:hypothetical protein